MDILILTGGFVFLAAFIFACICGMKKCYDRYFDKGQEVFLVLFVFLFILCVIASLFEILTIVAVGIRYNALLNSIL